MNAIDRLKYTLTTRAYTGANGMTGSEVPMQISRDDIREALDRIAELEKENKLMRSELSEWAEFDLKYGYHSAPARRTITTILTISADRIAELEAALRGLIEGVVADECPGCLVTWTTSGRPLNECESHAPDCPWLKAKQVLGDE